VPRRAPDEMPGRSDKAHVTIRVSPPSSKYAFFDRLRRRPRLYNQQGLSSDCSFALLAQTSRAGSSTRRPRHLLGSHRRSARSSSRSHIRRGTVRLRVGEYRSGSRRHPPWHSSEAATAALIYAEPAPSYSRPVVSRDHDDVSARRLPNPRGRGRAEMAVVETRRWCPAVAQSRIPSSPGGYAFFPQRSTRSEPRGSLPRGRSELYRARCDMTGYVQSISWTRHWPSA